MIDERTEDATFAALYPEARHLLDLRPTPRGALDDIVALERDIDRAIALLTDAKTRLRALRRQ